MKTPYDGNVRIELIIKRFKQKVLYCVGKHKNNEFSIVPCLLSKSSSIRLPMLQHFNSDMELNKTFSKGAKWSSIFHTIEEAESELRRVKSLYFDGFSKKPFVSIEILGEHKDDLLKIEKDITRLLKFDDKFNGVYFSDVSAGGIQVGGIYGNKTIKYDFSNKHDVVIDFVTQWNEFANK